MTAAELVRLSNKIVEAMERQVRRVERGTIYSNPVLGPVQYTKVNLDYPDFTYASYKDIKPLDDPFIVSEYFGEDWDKGKNLYNTIDILLDLRSDWAGYEIKEDINLEKEEGGVEEIIEGIYFEDAEEVLKGIDWDDDNLVLY